MKTDVFTVAEGQIILEWPDKLHQDEIDDIKIFMELVIRQMKRAADKHDANKKKEEM